MTFLAIVFILAEISEKYENQTCYRWFFNTSSRNDEERENWFS